jgi:hypothetical protein
MLEERSIDDLLGEALRRHRHGQIRPLWRDMPEGDQKKAWRRLGRRWIESRHGARNAAFEAAAHIIDEAADAMGGGSPSRPGVKELRHASRQIRDLVVDRFDAPQPVSQES